MFVGGTYRPEGRRQRLFSKPRRRLGRGWIVFAVIAVFVAVAWLWAFQRGPDSVPGSVPTLHADNQPTRKKPDDPGGLKVTDVDPLDSNRVSPNVERLMPPPEAPLPRPTADSPATGPQSASAATPSNGDHAAQTLSPIAVAANQSVGPPVQLVPANQNQNPNQSPPTTATPAPKGPVAPAAVKAASPPPPPAAQPTKPIPAPAAAVPSAPAPAVQADAAGEAAPKPMAPVAGQHGFRIQLASVKSEDQAKSTWASLKRSHADILGTLELSVMQVELGDRGTFYRVTAGPLTQVSANQICDALKRQGAACILVRS